MKKVLGIVAVVALSAVMFTSCGKKCHCTRYEDGKKVSVYEKEMGTKYFAKDACTVGSVKEHEGYTLASMSADGTPVTCKVKVDCK